MSNHKIIPLFYEPSRKDELAAWFHSKWRVPEEAYLESMAQCISGQNPVPRWYGVYENDTIIGGLGVIENDFHSRKDLTPNVCAVYVEKPYRCRGIAGQMLDFVCKDMKNCGIDTLYLVTNHTSFYERYGWDFFCHVLCDDDSMSRMYVHREP